MKANATHVRITLPVATFDLLVATLRVAWAEHHDTLADAAWETLYDLGIDRTVPDGQHGVNHVYSADLTAILAAVKAGSPATRMGTVKHCGAPRQSFIARKRAASTMLAKAGAQ